MSSKTYTDAQQAALIVWLEKECPETRIQEINNVGPMYGDYHAELASLCFKARQQFPDIDEDSIDGEVWRHLNH